MEKPSLIKTPAVTSSSTSSALDVPTIDRHVRQVLHTDAALRRIEIFLRPTSLNVSYLLTLSDGTQATLKLPPPPHIPTLRHEQRSLEASVLLYQMLENHREIPVPPMRSYDLSPNTLQQPFILSSHISGPSLRDLAPRLPPTDYEIMTHNLNRILTTIGHFTSNYFGTLPQVSAGQGSSTWKCAFSGLVETVLRDAEDMVIAIPYEQIRDHVSRLGPFLHEVQEPKLVLLMSDPLASLIVDEERMDVKGFVLDCPALWGDPLLARVFDDVSETFHDRYSQTMGEGEEVRTLLYVSSDFHHFRHCLDDPATSSSHPTSSSKPQPTHHLPSSLHALAISLPPPLSQIYTK